MHHLDDFYLQKQEPIKSCLLTLKEIILAEDKDITTAWKYGMPFFCYKGKLLCYLWVHKKLYQPYIGIVEGGSINYPQLIAENRSRMKINLLNPTEDLPLKTIKTILKQATELYKSEEIKIKNK